MFSIRIARLNSRSSRLILTESANIQDRSPSSSNRQRNFAPVLIVKRNFSATEAPWLLKPLINYGSDAYITQGLHSALEMVQSSGLSPVASFIAMGVTLRLLSFPAHFYAEKLLAKRVHIVNFLTQNVLKKASETYGLKLVPNEAKTQITLDTKDPAIKMRVHQIISKQVNEFSRKNGIQRSRILNLKVMTVPIWFYSSFAIRNCLTENSKPVFEGLLWMPHLSEPDPYFIIPICVGLVGFLNIYSQRIAYPSTTKSKNVFDAFLVFVTLFGVKMMTLMPVCIPMYWLTVSATGILQSQLLRHSKVKKLLGINRLPTDSATPFRDLLLLKRNRGGAPPSII